MEGAGVQHLHLMQPQLSWWGVKQREGLSVWTLAGEDMQGKLLQQMWGPVEERWSIYAYRSTSTMFTDTTWHASTTLAVRFEKLSLDDGSWSAAIAEIGYPEINVPLFPPCFPLYPRATLSEVLQTSPEPLQGWPHNIPQMTYALMER